MEDVDDEKIILEKKQGKGEKRNKKRGLAILRCPLLGTERAGPRLERCVDVVK